MYTFKVHCRDIKKRRMCAVYVEIDENNEELAMLEAGKNPDLKPRKAYFAGTKEEKKRRNSKEVV